MSDRLSADEESRLVGEIDQTLATVSAIADGFAAEPPAGIDLPALQAALARIPQIATRLKARAGLDARRRADKTLDEALRVVSERIVPRLIHLLLVRTPVPGGPTVVGRDPTALDLAEIYPVLTAWLIRRDPRHAAVSRLQRGLYPLIDQTRAYVEAAEAAMEGPDYPDLKAIANNLLRLDVLAWVFVTAGFPREVVEVQAKTRRLARSAMRRATVVMNRCAATFGLVDRINLAGTISEIDDLVLVFQRVRQAEREEMPDGEEAFVQSLGAEVIAEFTKAVTGLSRSIMETFVNSALDFSATRGGEIAGMLRALVKLRQLLTGVRDDAAMTSIEQTTGEIRRGLTRIRQHIAAAIEKARVEQSLAHATQLEIMSKAFAALSAEIDGRA